MEVTIIILATLAGLLAGLVTGLTPGIHNNLVTSFAISLVGFNISLPIAAFVVALAMSHTILDFIPTVYLGVADETVLSILPGHELLLAGKGDQAVNLLLRGALYAILFSPIFIFLFFMFASTVQSTLAKTIPIILVGIITFMLAKEEKPIKAMIFFILAGFLGYATLHLPVKEPLTPLLTGLFGLSGIVLSLTTKVSLPKQSSSEDKIPKEDSKRSLMASIIAAPIFSFLPALGSGYAALFGSEIIKQSRSSFLMLNGFLNVQVTLLSFALVYLTSKARTGAAAAIEPILNQSTIFIILVIAIAISLISIFLAKRLSVLLANLFSKIDYRTLSLATLVLVLVINFFITNLLGMLVLVTATALGIAVINSGIRRVNMMACLLVPTIIIYVS